jgi:glutamate receptor, ionotropic, plant
LTYSRILIEILICGFKQEFDAVVGDVTILANRSNYVDFAFSYTEPGISMIVADRKNIKSGSWIFLKPLTTGLWVATLCFVLFTGFVVWVIEHRINPELRGNPSQQLGITLYFSFSALFFSHSTFLLNFYFCIFFYLPS